MGRWIRRGLVAVTLLAVVTAAGLWWITGRIGVERVTDRLYMLTGIGGNVGVLITTEGVVVVDTMTLARQGSAILARIAGLTDQPVVAVINTHYHLDHTHGNPAFAPGTRVIATDRTLRHLRELDAAFWKDSPARELMPNDTFSDTTELRFGGDVIRLVHPGRGHTDGDLAVVYVAQNVLQTGDLLFHGHYPNIDLEAGGSVREWIATLDRVKGLEFDRVIPGHGPLTDRAAIDRFQAFLRSLWSQTSSIVEKGGSLADAEEEVDLSSFDLEPIWFAPYLDRDFVIGRAFEEASRGNSDGP